MKIGRPNKGETAAYFPVMANSNKRPFLERKTELSVKGWKRRIGMILILIGVMMIVNTSILIAGRAIGSGWLGFFLLLGGLFLLGFDTE